MKKPEKYIIIDEYAECPISYRSPPNYEKAMSLESFISWQSKIIPKNAYDPVLELNENHCYDDCIATLTLRWKRKIINPNYQKDLLKYNKKIKK